ncbi:hypothetical protein [Streptomyces sp. SPB162]|nr:hypothetical protein [Streptomyces sp. SPB162]MDF9817243.1 hypothetical protein [Streptomyces sp. SPB162]
MEELAAVMALHRHPKAVAARAEKRWMQLHRELKAAIDAEGWPAAK